MEKIGYRKDNNEILFNSINTSERRYHSVIISTKDYKEDFIRNVTNLAGLHNSIKFVRCSSLSRSERISLLRNGVDDVITSDVDCDELAIKTFNLVQRVFCCSSDEGHNFTIRFGKLRVDPENRLIQIGEKTHSLTDGEHQILLHLIGNRGKYTSRKELSKAIGKNHHSNNSRSIDMLIGRLRKKLLDNPKMPEYIVTSRGRGYMLIDRA
ncbi:winged helix-turn-helix domain-containing protein [Grimontia celer]|uniref:winged helix-turn-helix domain-containing protein n=1 Tax=Grimontia celer TaxID=1796497 RepID=UPI0018D33F9E|nr:response regulator transcription factor [Grimontia celer]